MRDSHRPHAAARVAVAGRQLVPGGDVRAGDLDRLEDLFAKGFSGAKKWIEAEAKPDGKPEAKPEAKPAAKPVAKTTKRAKPAKRKARR